MNFDMRDILIGLNIIAMIGGAFFLVGMLRQEIRHLSVTIEQLRRWLERMDGAGNDLRERIAHLESRLDSQSNAQKR